MRRLIDAGYANRLMHDDLPGGAEMLKPELKGYEAGPAPWETSSEEGCAFWVKGKCHLHNIGLKLIEGEVVIIIRYLSVAF